MSIRCNRADQARHASVRVLVLVAALSAPCAAFAQRSQIVIDDTRVFPESITSSANGTIFIGSIGHGTIYRAKPGAAKATSWIAAGPNDLNTVLGVFAHDATNTLYVCSNVEDPKSDKTGLRSFDLKTGAPKGTYPFPGSGVCNDIAVASDGTTFVTDTRGGRILTLAPGGSALQLWGVDAAWVGIDGIAMLADGAVLFNNVRQNQLVRVARNSDGSAGAATVLTLSQPLDGPDGMRSQADGSLLLAENRAGKLDLVHISGDQATIQTVKDGFKFTPTAVTVVGKTAWVLEAKFAYRNDPVLKTQDPGVFSATAVPLPRH